MKRIILHTSVLVAPTAVWVAVTSIGFGAQSLANLIELPFVWLGSLILVFIPEKFINLRLKFLIGAVLVLILRACMPVIPE